MRPSRIILACVLALAMAPMSGTAKTTRELLSDLQAALKDEAAAAQQPAPRDSATAQRELMVPYLTQQLDGHLLNGDYGTASVLTQISASSGSEKVQQICRELGAQLQTEREQKETEFAAAADAAVKHAGEAALQAKEEKDMDVVLQEIGRLHGDRYEQQGSELSRRAYSKLQAASQFASRWQDYLAHVKSGNPKAARNILQNLSQDTSYPIVPRSEILARMQTVADAEANAARESGSSITSKADALCQSIHTPADIARALPELKALRREFPSEVDSSLVSELERLGSVYHQIQAGVNVSIIVLNTSRDFTELRLQLILLALPRYLGVSDRLPSLPQDTVGTFLDRVIADAKKTANWPLLFKSVVISRSIARDGATDGTAWRSDTDSLREFIVGQNEEQAAQYAAAVTSYETALKDTEDLVPMSVVRDRLAALKQAHPAEYEEGSRQAFNPRVSSRYPPGAAPPPPPVPPTPPAASVR